MHVSVNGTRLWFDVDGPVRVPDDQSMSSRPTVVLVHGGPGSYDHSCFKPDFAHLTGAAQVVCLDLRGHGLSEWGRPEDWRYELCADDLRSFCGALGIGRPVVFGHSSCCERSTSPISSSESTCPHSSAWASWRRALRSKRPARSQTGYEAELDVWRSSREPATSRGWIERSCTRHRSHGSSTK